MSQAMLRDEILDLYLAGKSAENQRRDVLLRLKEYLTIERADRKSVV